MSRQIVSQLPALTCSFCFHREHTFQVVSTNLKTVLVVAAQSPQDKKEWLLAFDAIWNGT